MYFLQLRSLWHLLVFSPKQQVAKVAGGGPSWEVSFKTLYIETEYTFPHVAPNPPQRTRSATKLIWDGGTIKNPKNIQPQNSKMILLDKNGVPVWEQTFPWDNGSIPFNSAIPLNVNGLPFAAEPPMMVRIDLQDSTGWKEGVNPHSTPVAFGTASDGTGFTAAEIKSSWRATHTVSWTYVNAPPNKELTTFVSLVNVKKDKPNDPLSGCNNVWESDFNPDGSFGYFECPEYTVPGETGANFRFQTFEYGVRKYWSYFSSSILWKAQPPDTSVDTQLLPSTHVVQLKN